MPRRFSSEELFVLRNRIPIEWLIEKDLSISSRREDGRLRFACPLCAGYDTSINKSSNLARCFDCVKNFNTIEIVMAKTKAGFVEAVKRLKECHADMSKHGKSHKREGKTASFSSLGEIIPGVIPLEREAKFEKTDPSAANSQILLKRIEDIEEKLDRLCQRFEILCRVFLQK